MAETLHCERCGEPNPADARFCIECGASLAPAETGPTVKLSGKACGTCRSLNPEEARFCAVCGSSFGEPAQPTQPPLQLPRVGAAPAPTSRQRPPAQYDMLPIAALIGGGLLLLFATKMLWPGLLGLLLLAFVAAAVYAIQRGRMDWGVPLLFMLVGIALMLVTKSFWPWFFIFFIFGPWRWGRPGGGGRC